MWQGEYQEAVAILEAGYCRGELGLRSQELWPLPSQASWRQELGGILQPRQLWALEWQLSLSLPSYSLPFT